MRSLPPQQRQPHSQPQSQPQPQARPSPTHYASTEPGYQQAYGRSIAPQPNSSIPGHLILPAPPGGFHAPVSQYPTSQMQHFQTNQHSQPHEQSQQHQHQQTSYYPAPSSYNSTVSQDFRGAGAPHSPGQRGHAQHSGYPEAAPAPAQVPYEQQHQSQQQEHPQYRQQQEPPQYRQPPPRSQQQHQQQPQYHPQDTQYYQGPPHYASPHPYSTGQSYAGPFVKRVESMVGRPDFPAPMENRGERARFLPTDDQLLKNLKERTEPKLSWDQIAEFFPGRKSGTLQVRYCTKLKEKGQVDWTEDLDEKLIRSYAEYESERWKIIANRMGSGFSAAVVEEHFRELEERRMFEQSEGPAGSEALID